MSNVVFVNYLYSVMLLLAGYAYSYWLQADLASEGLDVLVNSGGAAAIIIILWYIVKYQSDRVKAEEIKNSNLQEELRNQLKEQLKEKEDEIRKLRERN